jgi:hypothetical protein
MARAVVVACGVVTLGPSSAVAQAASFSYTGDEQTYTVPVGVSRVQITAIGGAGGTPPEGTGVPGGRAAIVTGVVPVTPGQVLYVYVGGAGELPAGGYNGGGDGGTREWGMVWGGGGASDVSTVPERDGLQLSLESRMIVAAGGGGSAGIAAGGGDAGAPGGCCGAVGSGPYTARPGTQSAGGTGGCNSDGVGCGGSGSLGFGGDGGASGTGADARTGGGGGGGLYGGGGGAGYVVDQGGGAGGSSKVPPGGSMTIAQRTTPAGVEIAPYTPPPPPPRCADGLDNDGDGLTDFAADPGCISATDDDEANPTSFPPTKDTTAPAAKLTGPKTQKLGRTVATTLSCGAAEDCIAAAKGALSIRRTARRYALKPVRPRTIERGKQSLLRLRVPSKTRVAATRALRRGKKVRAIVTVTVADAVGNTRTLKRTIQVVR